jgi:hypothetical protein
MHDPMTVAFEIKRPWPQGTSITMRGKPWRYWPAWITIWHVDPERDGSDDSCGWSYVRLSKELISDLSFEAGCEARDPWLLRDESKRPVSIADAELKLRGAIVNTALRVNVRCSFEQATQLASELLHNPVDNCRSSLCFLAGWHTNFSEDRESDRKEKALGVYMMIARILLTRARPWWRHPRWHVWHWRVQIQPLQAFKRWVWSRCCKCGGRFKYGEAPTTYQWHSTGPLWFKSQEGIFHSNCDAPGSSNAAAGVAP